MSYDLMVFDNKKAPRQRDEFMKWYHLQTQWTEDHEYCNCEVTSPELKNWFIDIIEMFPPMNGPLSPSEDEVDSWEEHDYDKYLRITDYSIGCEVIYAAFSWKMLDQSYPLMKKLAKKHHVGFFNVSASEGEIEYND